MDGLSNLVLSFTATCTISWTKATNVGLFIANHGFHSGGMAILSIKNDDFNEPWTDDSSCVDTCIPLSSRESPSAPILTK